MKILVVCEKLDIDFTSSGVGRSKLLKCIGRGGNDVTCIFDQFNQTNTPEIEGIKLKRLQKENTVALYSILQKVGKINGLWHYLTGFNAEFRQLILHWRTAIKKELEENKYDLLIVLATGQQLSTFFALNKLNISVPYVLNFHDPYPEAFHPEYFRKLDGPFKIRVKIVKKLVERAYKITSPSLLLLNLLKNYYPIANKGVVIPHPGIAPKFSTKKEQSDKLSILHSGLLFGSRNPIPFLQALKNIVAVDTSVKHKLIVKFVGPCKIADPAFYSLIADLTPMVQIENKRISYEESLRLQQEADLLLLVDFDIAESPIMLGKLADYFALNKPIFALTPEQSETSRLLGSNYPLMSPVSNAEKIEKRLLYVIEQWEKGNLNAVNLSAQQYYVSCTNVNSIIEREILEKLKK